MDFQLDFVCTCNFHRVFCVSMHILHLPTVTTSWGQSHGFDELNIFSRQLVLNIWSTPHITNPEHHGMLRSIILLFYCHPLCLLTGSGVWILHCWGWRDEVAFNQQLVPHKAFITPKRLCLPKPEWDKHCLFICNDVEATTNWSELRGKANSDTVWMCKKQIMPVGLCYFTSQNNVWTCLYLFCALCWLVKLITSVVSHFKYNNIL